MPSAEFKVMVYRCHAEYSLPAGLFEICDLNDNRQSLTYEDEAGYREKPLNMSYDSSCRKNTAESHGSGVSHEYLRGVLVVDQESAARSSHDSLFRPRANTAGDAAMGKIRSSIMITVPIR